MDYICRILVRRPSFNTGFVVVFPWPPAANGHSHDCWPKLPESPFIFSGERTCLLNNKAGSSHLYLSVTNHYEDLYMKFLFVMKCLVYITIWFILNTNPPFAMNIMYNKRTIWQQPSKETTRNPNQCMHEMPTNLGSSLDVFRLSYRFHWRLISVEVSTFCWEGI